MYGWQLWLSLAESPGMGLEGTQAVAKMIMSN